MTKRRSYDKSAEAALKASSLGPRKRMDGMAKLMARAGKGLSYKLPMRKNPNVMSDSDAEEGEEEEDGESDEEEDDQNEDEEEEEEEVILG